MSTWLEAHNGVISMAEMERFGCPHRTAYRMVDRGELAILMPGAFRSMHWPAGDLQIMTAACLRNSRAIVGFGSAATLWHMRKLPKNRGIHILLPHECRVHLGGVVLHRCRRIDPTDIVSRADGIRVTSPTRTLFDCADWLGERVGSSILEQLINDGRGTFQTHLGTFARLGHPRRPGTRTLTEILGSRPAWRRALQSDLEALVLGEITRQGLPLPEVQLPFVLPGGDRIRLDFAWPSKTVTLEVDHPFWHAAFDESHRDKRRDRKMATVGWLTVRVTDLDVDGGLAEAVRDVGQVLAQR